MDSSVVREYRLGSLVASWIVGPLWGINVMLAILCFFVLNRLGTKGSNKYVLSMIAIQLGVCTGHLIALVVRLVRGFATTDGLAELVNLALPENVAQEAFYFINAQIGDWFMTWRVYVVWQRNKWLCVPFVLANTALFASCISGLINLSRLGPLDTAFDRHLKAQFILSLALSLFVQSLGALLIALRAWSTPMLVCEDRRRGRLDPVALVCVFVDTGAAYVIATLSLLVFFARKTVGGPIVLTVITGQISATVPMSIVLREYYKTSHARTLRAKACVAAPQSSIVPEQAVTPTSAAHHASPFGLPQGAVADGNVLVNVMRSTRADGPTTVVLRPIELDEERGEVKGERPRTPVIYW